ncbi:hypothetical protein [Cryptosporangium japonicum]|uniref:Uncharacterized protein n=1 Tax=Cryptosporangium japonicum TaxID=80872 RepID=A0ABN0TYY4_9ACTN
MPIDAPRVRSRADWFVAAGVVFVVSVLSGGALGLVAASSPGLESAAVVARSSGGRVDVRLEPGRGYDVLLPEDTASAGSCVVAPADGVQRRRSGAGVSRLVLEGTTWVARNEVTVRVAGTYGVTCGRNAFLVTDDTRRTSPADVYFDTGAAALGFAGVALAGLPAGTVVVLRARRRGRGPVSARS